MREKLLYFKDARAKQLKAAFNWAVDYQKRHGFRSKPIRFEFDGDYLEYDRSKCEVAMFYDKDFDWAILRRDWPDRFATCYNIVTNYREIEKMAPNSLRELLDNGVEMYMRYKNAGLA